MFERFSQFTKNVSQRVQQATEDFNGPVYVSDTPEVAIEKARPQAIIRATKICSKKYDNAKETKNECIQRESEAILNEIRKEERHKQNIRVRDQEEAECIKIPFKTGSCKILEADGYKRCNEEFYKVYRVLDIIGMPVVKTTPPTNVDMYIVKNSTFSLKNVLVTSSDHSRDDCELVKVKSFHSYNQGPNNALEQKFIFTIDSADEYNDKKIIILASEITDQKHHLDNANQDEIKYSLYCKQVPKVPVPEVKKTSGGHYRKSKKRQSKKRQPKKRTTRRRKSRKYILK